VLYFEGFNISVVNFDRPIDFQWIIFFKSGLKSILSRN